jgi:hypothetical protein
MRKKDMVNKSNLIIKTCLFCRKTFYAKRDSAKYCCESHKVQYNNWVKTAYYDNDPNEGTELPPGTITNQQMSENKLIFQGDKDSLYLKLLEIVSEEHLLLEKEFIENLIPFSTVKNWPKSTAQAFTDEYFMEVMRISPQEYKLYKESW